MKHVLWISVALLSAAYISGPLVDPDLWWHLVIGKWILAHRTVPVIDYWTMFGHGLPWRAYSWGPEVLFALVDNIGHITGLLVLKFFLAVCLSGSLAYCLSRISGDWFIGAILGMVTSVSTIAHFTLRPQSMVWIYFTWIIYFCVQIERRGLWRRYLVALAVLMALWANTHLSAVLGLAVVVLWLYRNKNFKVVLSATGAALAGTLVTPYLGGEWLTFFGKADHAIHYTWIAEFGPGTILYYPTAFMIIMSGLLAAALYFQPNISISKTLLLGIFFFGSLAVIKFMPFAEIVISSLIAVAWHQTHGDYRKLGNLGEALFKLKQLVLGIPYEGLSFVILVFAFLNLQSVWKEKIRYDAVPVAAVDFVEKHQLPHPILNTFGDGGYLLYRASDAQ